MNTDTTRRIREVEVLLKLLIKTPDVDTKTDTRPDSTLGAGPGPPLDALKAEIRPFGGGPLSLAALMGQNPEAFKPLEGRTLKQVLMDARVSPPTLSLLKTLGKTLLTPGFCEEAKLLGKALYFLSSAAAIAHGGKPISTLDREEFERGLTRSDWAEHLDNELRQLGTLALKRWKGNPPEEDDRQ